MRRTRSEITQKQVKGRTYNLDTSFNQGTDLSISVSLKTFCFL